MVPGGGRTPMTASVGGFRAPSDSKNLRKPSISCISQLLQIYSVILNEAGFGLIVTKTVSARANEVK